MRDPKRIKEFCDRLAKVWENVPDWRFGQILMNANVLIRCDFTKCLDPFYDESVKTLENMSIVED